MKQVTQSFLFQEQGASDVNSISSESPGQRYCPEQETISPSCYEKSIDVVVL